MFLCIVLGFHTAFAQSNYTWNNVRIVASGFVPGITYHPNVQGLVYARTDIGGLYCSTNGGANWTPLLDWVNWSNWGYSGVLSVALDPNNTNTVYAAVGAYTNSFDPNNQRILCGLPRSVTEEKGTQVLLTTHSRHVVDAVWSSSGFLWVRNGAVDVAQPEDEIGVLLEIGALDVKERAGQASTKVIVLTEDEITRPLEIVLSSSGFDLSTTAVLPYYGVTGIKQLRPLVNVISGTNPKAKIVLHRDLDFLTDAEAENWRTEVRALNVEPFLTKGRDIESHFINAKYLAELNEDVTQVEFEEMIETVTVKLQPQIIADYVNARIDIAKLEKIRVQVVITPT